MFSFWIWCNLVDGVNSVHSLLWKNNVCIFEVGEGKYCHQPPSTAINCHHVNRWEMVPPSLHQLIGTWKEATTPNLSPLRQLENSKRTFSVLTNFLNDDRLPPSTAINRHQPPSQKPLGNCTAITSPADQGMKISYQTKSQPSTTIREFKTGILSFN